MGGAAFPTKGATSQPTQTVWFGAVPDRLNMLCPATWSGAGSNPQFTSCVPANFGNQFTGLTDASFGAFTTAPDGTTNTAQLLVENTASDVQHIAYAMTNRTLTLSMNVGRLRAAVYAKSSNRRLTMTIFTDTEETAVFVQATFDLVGGQVGVAGNIQGSSTTSYTVYSTAIQKAANGFYLCTLDFGALMGGRGLSLQLTTDNGTGTNATSNTYTGDGSSGVYLWRTNMMPVGAYGINNVTFFDDFTSLSTIDTGNTLNPGFNWYINYFWKDYNTNVGSPPLGALSITGGSTLVIGPTGDTSLNELSIQTAAQLNATAGTYVGQGWKLPLLFEISMGWPDFWTNASGSHGSLGWSTSLEYLSTQATARPVNIGREMDFNEINNAQVSGGIGGPGHGIHAYFQGNTPEINGVTSVGWLGVPPWNATYNYGDGAEVTAPGSPLANPVYLSSQTNNTNNQPPNASFWTTANYPSGTSQCPFSSVDFSKLNTWSVLVLPFYGSSPLGPNGSDAVGNAWWFFNNAFVGVVSWAPQYGTATLGAGTYIYTSDGHTFPFMIGGDANLTTHVDFARIMQ